MATKAKGLFARSVSGLLTLCKAGWARGRWQCVLSGLPLALLALGAALVLPGFEGLPGLSRPTLGHLMRLEGYAFFTGFLFVWFLLVGGYVALLTARFIVWGGMAMIVSFITWILLSTRPGMAVVMQYFAMVAVTYLGAFIDTDGPASLPRWLLRVVWVVIAFFFTLLVTDTPLNIDSWSTEQGVMWAALVHFSLLSAMEFSGLYHLTLDDLARNGSGGPDDQKVKFAERLRGFAARRADQDTDGS